jgi:ElaB/YqjD/DUF883 family membrane-anchored ribosome-binding protein
MAFAMRQPSENNMNDNVTAIAGDAKNLANDGKAALNDGKQALNEAAAPLADKVRELHDKGMAAMDKVADTIDDVQDRTAKVKSQAVAATDAFVQENPWRSTLIAGVVGVLAGVIIARR